MKKAIVIPVRFGSTRLYGKPLRRISDKPLIQWVYENAKKSLKKDKIIIATDDMRILEVVNAFGGEAVITSKDCKSGTDRVYEAIKEKDFDIIVNVQGDEPFIRADMIDMLFDLMEKEKHEMATLCTFIRSENEFLNPNTVKVVLDRLGFALYFSRSPIPYLRDKNIASYLGYAPSNRPIYKHIGIYAFSRSFLETFVTSGTGLLEEMESLEQLRALENGHKIKVLVTDYKGFGIDTKEDLLRAEAAIAGLSKC